MFRLERRAELLETERDWIDLSRRLCTMRNTKDSTTKTKRAWDIQCDDEVVKALLSLAKQGTPGMEQSSYQSQHNVWQRQRISSIARMPPLRQHASPPHPRAPEESTVRFRDGQTFVLPDPKRRQVQPHVTRHPSFDARSGFE